jgi:hypothetical protein
MFPKASRNGVSSSMVGFISQANVGHCRQAAAPVHQSIPTARFVAHEARKHFEQCEIDALLSDSTRSLTSAGAAFEPWRRRQPATTAETVCSQALGIKKTGAEKFKPTKPKTVRSPTDFTELPCDAKASESNAGSTAGKTANSTTEAISRCASKPLLVEERGDGARATGGHV